VRSGRWWGYETAGFVPDIVTMGKPMGAGVPLGGVVARVELVEGFRRQTGYFNTFAASPLQAAAGAAVLDVIEQENLERRVNDVGAYLHGSLRSIDCPAIGDVRGHGLFLGIDWVSDPTGKTPDREGARRIVNRLRERGFLLESAGAHFNVLKIRPPLVFEREHADLFLEAFEQAVREAG
jgi:4-aminobutyrate aminotransferase-like enzyme